MRHVTWMLLFLFLLPGLSFAVQTDPATVRIEARDGGYRCLAGAYQVQFDKSGNLQSLIINGAEMLSPVSGAGIGAGFIKAGQLVPFRTITQEGADSLVVEGEPRTMPANAPATEHPVVTRAVYKFLPDRFIVTLEQHFEDYGYFAWFPSAQVTASYDAQTDQSLRMDQPSRYNQTDPRWITKTGQMLRFDFGVWQPGFANAMWSQLADGGKNVRYVANITPSWKPITMTAYPLAHPAAADALTFDVTAASPDFDMAGGKPVHFGITTTNAGADPVKATVRFEIRDYLTKKPVRGRSTTVKLAPGKVLQLPTDLRLKAPGTYRAAIVIQEGKKILRTVEWNFTYDFAQYNPPTTRPEDFDAFWKKALAESAAIPLDIKMTPVPEKSTATVEAFKLSFATLGSRRIYGWYARPKAPGKYPARLRCPSSGVYPIANPEIVDGMCTLWITITGFDVDLSNMPQGDDPGKNYWTAGISSPDTSMWRTIYVSLVRAIDVLLAQPQVDPARVISYGGSQGGGLAAVAAALDHRIGLCIPTYSGLARLDWTVKYAPGYWPFGMGSKPQGQTEEQFLRTLSYFDVANFTPDIQCPVLAEVGMMDAVTASGNQLAALAHIPRNRLYLFCIPWGGHATGSREGNRIWEYCDRFLKGQTPVIPVAGEVRGNK
ncbi:MAG: acetylxylan esterase [Armatimonadota bacterium]